MSILKISIFSIIATLLIACGKTDPLKPLQAVNLSSAVTHTVDVHFCTDPSYDQKQYLKTIVILDHSTSNQENFLMLPDGTGYPATPFTDGPQYGTDPTGQLRYGSVATPGTLLNYLSALPANDPADPTRFFALVNFSDNVQTFPSNSSGFTSDIPGFFNYVQNDALAGGSGPNDRGATHYMNALRSANQIISNDIQLAQNCAALPKTNAPTAACPLPGVEVASSYVIVFITDGSPVIRMSFDAGPPVTASMERIPATEILGQVAAIESLTSNVRFVTSINLFTVFYYNPINNRDDSAISLLANMARLGNGVAYTAQSGNNLDWTQFAPPSKRITFGLSDILVTNESATWWNDGRLHGDLDRDGLPDDVELAWGSDPSNPITDNNGVSDLVKYHLTDGAPCPTKNAMGRCTAAVVNYRTGACSGIPFSNGRFRSSDPSGLNDCEKRILNNNAGINNPDSNNDLLPDWIEFKNGVPFQVGTAPPVNTPSQDGYTDYQKIKFSLPLNMAAHQMLNLIPAKYNLTLVSSTPDQDCYSLRVTDLPVAGDNNQIRVDIIMKSDLLQSTYLYRVGKKSFVGNSSYLRIDDWTNPAEIAANTWQLWQ